MRFQVVKPHRSNYPDPIALDKGQRVTVGERYRGPEPWANWLFCTTLDGKRKGWVPEQLLRIEGGHGIVLEACTAKELDVDPGDQVVGGPALNGWVWCRRLSDGAEGWVPAGHLSNPDTTT